MLNLFYLNSGILATWNFRYLEVSPHFLNFRFGPLTKISGSLNSKSINVHAYITTDNKFTQNGEDSQNGNVSRYY